MMESAEENGATVRAEIIESTVDSVKTDLPEAPTVVNVNINDKTEAPQEESAIKEEEESNSFMLQNELSNADPIIGGIGEDDIADVSEDFFDDFNNKDFLAGLDVVDAWDDNDGEIKSSELVQLAIESVKAQNSTESSPSLDTESNRTTEKEEGSVSKVQEISNNEETKVNKLKKYTIPKRKSRSREEREEREEREGKQSREIIRDRDRDRNHRYSDEIRRDPDKVTRDIQRDKARCEKDRITDKLRIVETGLVPPGTEMDMPDNRDKTAAKSSAAERTSRERHDYKTVSRTGLLTTKRQYSRSPSPYRQRKRRYSRSRSPVPIVHVRKRYSPPPTFRRRSRTRSPVPPSYDRFDNRRKRHRSRSRDRSRDRNRSRSMSPLRRYQKISTERHASKQSRSPERKQSFLEELDRKLAQNEHAHLKNITAKLNGDSYASAHINHHNPMNPMSLHHNHNMIDMHAHAHPHSHSLMQAMPVPAPQIVPAPLAIDHPPYGGVVYDQSFFVGAGHVVDPNPYSMAYSQAACTPYEHMYATAQSVRAETNDETNRKLFNDDSIALTEYLKLTQRSDNAQQINLSHKVKVLNRCQDALTLMSSLQRPSGRFYYNVGRIPKPKDDDPSPSQEERSSLPLEDSSAHLRYTSKRTSNEKQPTAISRLLSRLNIKEKYIKISLGGSKSQEDKTFDDIAVQTVEYECSECSVRKKIKHLDVGVQCTPETMEFSAQVTEDDFLSTARSALKTLLKHQSFASLTPAQILAQLSDNKDEKTPSARGGDCEERGERRAQPSQDFERRERTSGDFERRTDWSQRQYSQSPQKQSVCGGGGGGGYHGRLHDRGPQGGYPMGGNMNMPQQQQQPVPLLGMGPMQGHRQPRSQFRAPHPNQNPNGGPGNFGNFGPNTMGNYPMRRFN